MCLSVCCSLSTRQQCRPRARSVTGCWCVDRLQQTDTYMNMKNLAGGLKRWDRTTDRYINIKAVQSVSVWIGSLCQETVSTIVSLHWGEKRNYTKLCFVMCWLWGGGGGGGQNGCVQEWVLLCQVFKERKWLGHVSYASGHMQYSVPRVSPKAPLPQSFQVSQSFQVTLVYSSTSPVLSGNPVLSLVSGNPCWLLHFPSPFR